MIGQMVGFSDLGSSLTSTFLFRNRFYLQLFPHCSQMNRKSIWEVKKSHDFCPRDIEFCQYADARRLKVWSLNAILFFEEPHQFTKIASQVHLNHIWQRKFPVKALIAIFWDLQPLWWSSLTKPDLLRFRCSSGHVLSKTKSVTPHFFAFLTSLTRLLSMVEFSEKSECQKNFARTSLQF